MSILGKIFNRKRRNIFLPEGVPPFEGSIEPSPPIGDEAISFMVIEPPLLPENKPISSIPSIPPRVLRYQQYQYRRVSAEFEEPEYNLVEILAVEDVESIVRQAHRKKLGLLFKEGWDLVGRNLETTTYCRLRFAQIARASDIPTELLLRRIGKSLINTSNAFLVKVRDETASGGKLRTDPVTGRTLKPVAAYFPAPPATMFPKYNKKGKVMKWRQKMPDGRYRDFPAEDVVHFKINAKEGFTFGTPDLVPVMDDIRALRQIEENVELLVHQYLFPLFQYIVGTEDHPAGLTEEGEDELEVVEARVENLPPEGVIVTPERHEIRYIGAEGKALKPEELLEYFKKRVIAGLGISTIDLGEAATANRASARTLSRQLVDTVKDIQLSLAMQFNHFILSELLLESPWASKGDVLSDKYMVRLQFSEIDIDTQIEREKHAADLFESNGITLQEFRKRLGKEPFPLPEDPHDQEPGGFPRLVLYSLQAHRGASCHDQEYR